MLTPLALSHDIQIIPEQFLWCMANCTVAMMGCT